MSQVRNKSRYLLSRRRQMVHASRMTAAGLGAYALVYLLGLSEGLWVIITAIVVTQSSVGGSLKMALDQAVGSLFGAIYATAVVLLISPQNHLESVAALILALVPLSFLSALYPGYRAAPITGVIMLLAGAGLGLGPIDLAIDRIIEVTLGCCVGVLISVLIAPARASQAVIETTAKAAELLAQQLRAIAAYSDKQPSDLGSNAKRIRETMMQLERLVGEATRERRALLTDIPDVEPLLRTTGRLRHDVNMLRRAVREAESDVVDDRITEAFRNAVLTGAARLEKIGEGLRLGASSKSAGETDIDDLSEAVRKYRQTLQAMRESGATRQLSTAVLTRLFGTGQTLDQFRRNLGDLTARYEEVTPRTKSRPPSQPAAGEG
jgi:uncharacterized membrane protein YccC